MYDIYVYIQTMITAFLEFQLWMTHFFLISVQGHCVFLTYVANREHDTGTVPETNASYRPTVSPSGHDGRPVIRLR